VNIQGGSKKVSCWHSTTAYFFEPPCISYCSFWQCCLIGLLNRCGLNTYCKSDSITPHTESMLWNLWRYSCQLSCEFCYFLYW